MRLFCWLSASEIPENADLRRCDWWLAGAYQRIGSDRVIAPTLADIATIGSARWARLIDPRRRQQRRGVLLIGVNHPAERARMLRLGFGDVLPRDVMLGEVDMRARRIAERLESLPRYRECRGLRLDLLVRDAFAGATALGLHPREFDLLWRLVEEPGRVFSRAVLAAEVWRLNHVPETNSIAVHVRRLRAKLELAGYAGLVQTAAGGYFLVPAAAGHAPSALRATTDAPSARRWRGATQEFAR